MQILLYFAIFTLLITFLP